MCSERKFKEMQYLLRFPEKFSETEKHPVLILMHGTTLGESVKCRKAVVKVKVS